MEESKIIPQQRRNQIVDIIKDRKIIDVSYLMKVFHSSRATITRDIKILVKEGLVTRTYGGIMSSDEGPSSINHYSFDSSKSEFITEKRAIAKVAFSLLKNNETVILNPGVTTFEIAKLIAASQLNINLITNSLKFFDFFAEDNYRKVLLLGGELLHGGHYVSGPLSTGNMNSLQGDIAIIGVHGIDLSGGLSYPYSQEAELESIMLRRSKKRIVVADHIKHGRVCLYQVDFNLRDIDIVITDRGTDKKYIDDLAALGIDVLIADVPALE